jgi:predicted CopG family antitoxin
MISPSIRDEVLRELEKLGAADQQRVMDFLRALGSAKPRGTAGSDLTRFAGTLSEESVDEMMAAIEEGCERIDDEW